MNCDKTNCVHYKVCKEWKTLDNDNYINDSYGQCEFYKAEQPTGDLISRSELEKQFEKNEDRKGYLQADWEVLIDNATAVEVEITEKQAICFLINNGWLVNHDKELREKWKRPQGEWEDVWQDGVTFRGTCTHCKTPNDIPPPEFAHFCPTCGADMRGGEES